MQPNQFLENYYNDKCDEASRLLTRHGSVEFLTTMHYIKQYLTPGAKILEIGAATGIYSHTIAQMGYTVDAVELLEKHIKLFKQNTQADETVTITQGNAMDLSGFPDCAYDITLLLGPMYHLYTDEDKHMAMSEALRVTKHGGIVFTAYAMSDALILDGGFMERRWSLNKVIEQGYVDEETFACVRTDPHQIIDVIRIEKIDAIMAEYPVTRLHFVSADGCWAMSKALEEMDDALFELYVKYHFATCERADMVGLSCHAIDIFRKV